MKKILFVSIISFMTLNEIEAQGTWIQKADFGGVSRFLAVGFSIGAKGYIRKPFTPDQIKERVTPLLEVLR